MDTPKISEQNQEYFENLKATLSSMLTLSIMNMEMSEHTKACSPIRWSYLLCKEAEELEEAVKLHKDSDKDKNREVIDELGDVLGNAFALIQSLNLSEEEIRDIYKMNLYKFRTRKPWIFPEYEGERPKDEAAEWNRLKTLDKK